MKYELIYLKKHVNAKNYKNLPKSYQKKYKNPLKLIVMERVILQAICPLIPLYFVFLKCQKIQGRFTVTVHYTIHPPCFFHSMLLLQLTFHSITF